MVINFVICPYVFIYIRSVSLCSALISIFCQPGDKSSNICACRIYKFVHGNISNEVTVAKMTMHRICKFVHDSLDINIDLKKIPCKYDL